jgi:glycosyltransferase involved in cell wall biosynthesis
MNVLILAHNSLSSNSGNHVYQLAKGLAALGVDVAAAVPDGQQAAAPSDVAFRVLTYSVARELRFSDGRGADLIHAWTPRQHVVRGTRDLARLHDCPYVVHLEDNEHAITAAYLKLPIEELLSRAALNTLNVPEYLAHPTEMRRFIDEAAGITALIDRLLEFGAPGQRGIEFWPAAEDELFHPMPGSLDLRRNLKIGDATRIVVYHGNVHPANYAEVRTLYLAIEALIRAGTDLALIRLGQDHSAVSPEEGLAALAPRIRRIPFQSRKALPSYLALADLFVQPGRGDSFNDYRFPSKLPEFFAMARPVVLPASNVGLRTRDREDAMVLKFGSALEIAGAVKQILADSSLARRLSANARRFYEEHFSWSLGARKVMDFYSSVETQVRLDNLTNDRALLRLAKHYAGYRPDEPLGYATVRDYSDSVDRLYALATLNRDLKDVQRTWVLKAILGAVPIGGRLLEIGAGDPWVADLLSRIGYSVVVVDPYDGRDRGPDQYELIKAQYPHITFLRGLFPDALSSLNDQAFDCIYSISVLEHLPAEVVKPVFDGIACHSRAPDSPTIHAIDHVLLGNGAEAHYALLAEMVHCLGFSEAELGALFARLERDPDAYFLSAEAHNLWRGAVPYESFPMRRCVSVQLYCPAGGVRAAVEGKRVPRSLHEMGQDQA